MTSTTSDILWLFIGVCGLLTLLTCSGRSCACGSGRQSAIIP